LTEEPKRTDNGNRSQTSQKESSEGHNNASDSRGADDGGVAGEDKSDTTEAQKQRIRSRNKRKLNQYPNRKGNATKQLLVDTFDFNSVTIPDSQVDTLKAVYDYLMGDVQDAWHFSAIYSQWRPVAS
jgi:hypothetical protein